MGNKKRATCFATSLQNELNTFYHPKNSCNLISCKTCSNVGGKTHNIAIQFVLKQCHKTSCTFFFASFTVALITENWPQNAGSLYIGSSPLSEADATNHSFLFLPLFKPENLISLLLQGLFIFLFHCIGDEKVSIKSCCHF